LEKIICLTGLCLWEVAISHLNLHILPLVQERRLRFCTVVNNLLSILTPTSLISWYKEAKMLELIFIYNQQLKKLTSHLMMVHMLYIILIALLCQIIIVIIIKTRQPYK